jgi:hypothetical protein
MWTSLYELLRRLTWNRAAELSSYKLVAVTVVLDEETSDLEHPALQFPEPDPAAIQPGWSFMGFDVADAWLEAALYLSSPVSPVSAVMQAELGGYLNENNLFAELAHAVRCRDLLSKAGDCEGYYIYGAWSINDQGMRQT